MKGPKLLLFIPFIALILGACAQTGSPRSSSASPTLPPSPTWTLRPSPTWTSTPAPTLTPTAIPQAEGSGLPLLMVGRSDDLVEYPYGYTYTSAPGRWQEIVDLFEEFLPVLGWTKVPDTGRMLINDFYEAEFTRGTQRMKVDVQKVGNQVVVRVYSPALLHRYRGNAYFPLFGNMEWWYLVFDPDDRLVDYTNRAILGFIEDAQGNPVHVIATWSPRKTALILGYVTSSEEDLRLVRTVFYALPDTATKPETAVIADGVFRPGIPFLRLPLSQGRAWSEDVMLNAQQDQYEYVVEEYMETYQAEDGREFSECYSVVRRFNGEEDDRTVYCAREGVVNNAWKSASSTWFRAIMRARTTARLQPIGVVQEEEGCRYFFTIVGDFGPGPYTATLFDVGTGEFVSQTQVVKSTFSIVVPPQGDRFTGGLYVEDVQGNGAFYTPPWTQTCGVTLLHPIPGFEPSVSLGGVMAQENGEQRYFILGLGWEAREEVTWTVVDPEGSSVIQQTVTANDQGVLPSLVFMWNPEKNASGMYRVVAQGDSQEVVLPLECGPQICTFSSGK